MNEKSTVYVGLSGGVDSSVAALRLKDEGYYVVGVFIRVWQPDFLTCDWEKERLDAMRVAAHLDIPFLTCDAREGYKKDVADYFISEYKAGRTPNPDVMCNQHVKFGAFLDFAIENGADYIATGHYAQKKTKDGLHKLYRGLDSAKDQSYFLWTLTQAQLDKTLFPVGDTPKELIRKEAEEAHIPVAKKDDSQGVCFLGHIDIPEFLSHYIELTKGDVLNPTGEVIGVHKGALVYTKGQRHGFSITSNGSEQVPHYVINRNIEQNTVTVDTHISRTTPGDTISLESINWIADTPNSTQELEAQIRYRQKPFNVRVRKNEVDYIVVEPLDAIDWPAEGQSCVLYDGTECVGGGIILKC